LRIAVVGVGLIGGSVGLAAKQRLEGVEVAGFDPGPGVLDSAREHGAIDYGASSVAEALDGAHACFVCAPVGTLPALVAEALEAAGEDCVVTDVGSTKRVVAAAAADPRFVGGHPVAGAETSGVEAARADLFEGAAWYLTPGERTEGLLYERLHRILVGFGAQTIAIDPETHDRLLATVSHLPHVLANVLVSQAARTLTDVGEALPRVGPSFRDATRVAGANPAIWTDIYSANREAIAQEIEETVDRLQKVAAALRSDDGPAIAAWNEVARDDRRRLLEAELAGGAVHELRVSVPNQPGIVAQVSLALGKGGVNILDMALAPAPDMRSGAITFWIAGDEPAERARHLIEELGFPVGAAA
jgi:prephenate dehydrogenase